jgi:hypothetical protein
MDIMGCDGLDYRLSTFEHLMKAIHIEMMVQIQPMIVVCSGIHL